VPLVRHRGVPRRLPIEQMESFLDAQLIAAVTEGRLGLVGNAFARDQSRILVIDSVSADGRSGVVVQLFQPRA
jgi:hypothetical protein